jgi:hypothetical protein
MVHGSGALERTACSAAGCPRLVQQRRRSEVQLGQLRDGLVHAQGVRRQLALRRQRPLARVEVLLYGGGLLRGGRQVVRLRLAAGGESSVGRPRARQMHASAAGPPRPTLARRALLLGRPPYLRLSISSCCCSIWEGESISCGHRARGGGVSGCLDWRPVPGPQLAAADNSVSGAYGRIPADAPSPLQLDPAGVLGGAAARAPSTMRRLGGVQQLMHVRSRAPGGGNGHRARRARGPQGAVPPAPPGRAGGIVSNARHVAGG